MKNHGGKVVERIAKGEEFNAALLRELRKEEEISFEAKGVALKNHNHQDNKEMGENHVFL